MIELYFYDTLICDFDINNDNKIINFHYVLDSSHPLFHFDLFKTADGVQQWVDNQIEHSSNQKDLLLSKKEFQTFSFLLAHGQLLSLSNGFWIKHDDGNLHWKDVNLYENYQHWTFNPPIFNFSACNNLAQITITGTLNKCWIYQNKTFYLRKQNDPQRTGNMSANEALISKILCQSGINCVNYTYDKRSPGFSFCVNFTSENISLIPASLFNANYTETDLVSKFKLFIAELKRLAGEEAYLKFCEMKIMDLIIFNVDRHNDNFGLLYNNETKQFTFAPLYDNGFSLQSAFDMIWSYTGGNYYPKATSNFENAMFDWTGLTPVNLLTLVDPSTFNVIGRIENTLNHYSGKNTYEKNAIKFMKNNIKELKKIIAKIKHHKINSESFLI